MPNKLARKSLILCAYIRISEVLTGLRRNSKSQGVCLFPNTSNRPCRRVDNGLDLATFAQDRMATRQRMHIPTRHLLQGGPELPKTRSFRDYMDPRVSCLIR